MRVLLIVAMLAVLGVMLYLIVFALYHPMI